MCGIAGLIKLPDVHYPSAVLHRMLDQVTHRGPDDQGSVWFTQKSNRIQASPPDQADWSIGIGSRRLAILDTSMAGHQPMSYSSNFWISFNGEIYNYKELRADLKALGHQFQSGTDTEVALAAYAQWGDRCFDRFRGMWALILLDLASKDAVVARGHLGIKPLYLWQAPGMLAIVSETKQLLCLPNFRPKLNHIVAAEYLGTGYEGAETFFDGVVALPQGTSMHIALETLEWAKPQEHWLPERIEVAVGDSEQAAKLFAYKLEESVRLHLRSDVPVGCSLSGGLDSASLAMLVNSIEGDREPLNTFTCVFPGHVSDEGDYANMVINAIRATPHWVVPTAEGFIEDIDHFTWIHDEPVGGLSVYAGYCLARLTAQAGIKVSLSGQGGDEILGGYWQSYFLYLRELTRSGQVMPLLSHLAGAVMPGGNSVLVRQFPVMLRRYWARRYPLLVASQTNERESLLREMVDSDPRSRRLREVKTFFLPRLLRWEDRNSMAFSVEGRYPYLDHELVDLCLALASSTLYHRGWSKWPLRLGLAKLLPKAVARRRQKFGLETPQEDWLRGALRSVLQTWLRQDRPVWSIVRQAQVQILADEVWNTKTPRQEASQALFRVFMFDKWLERFGVAIS